MTSMPRLASYLFLGFMSLLFAALVLTVSDVLPMQRHQRELQRQKDVAQIAKYISDFKKSTGSLPALPDQPLQLGTGETGCKIHTTHCAIETDTCLNLNTLTQNKNQTFPSDLKIGSLYHTGYAVGLSGNTLTVIACGGETTQKIIHESILE